MDNIIYVYHPTTGELIGSATADESPLEPGVLLMPAGSTTHQPPSAPAGFTAVFNAAADAWELVEDHRGTLAYSVVDGARVVVSELGPLGPAVTHKQRPSPAHDWNGVDWAVNEGRQIAAAWAAIRTERDRRKNLGFMCAGRWYHSDAESKTQHLGNKDTARDQLAAGDELVAPLRDPVSGQVIVWKTMDGQFVPLTCGLAIDIVAAGKSAEFKVFAAAETHRAQMMASPDPGAYDFTGGWPAVFGE